MSEKRNIPKEIGGYKIIEILGEGGMSVVYTAMQEHPKRKVAIKVLRGGLFSQTAAKRFHQEVEILGKLDHPWIGKVYDAGTHDEGNGATPYYVMEHVDDARELTEYLEESALERREILKLFTMITSAVEHGHHRQVVHRDLKPGNILIDSSGEPKIIDFGVARSLDRDTVKEDAMTEAGRLVGTVQFMAPEQVDAKITDIDARCDVYALGAVLYQMLTGKLPRTLEGLPIYEAVRQICQEDPIRPTLYDDTIDKDLEAIIMMALETKREKRYQTAGAFGRDMLRYLGNRTIKARHATKFDRMKLFCKRHQTQLVVTSSIVFILAVVLSGILYWRAESDSHVGELQAQGEALQQEIENLKNAATETPSTDEVTEVLPILSLTPPLTDSVISQNGHTLAAVVDDEYFTTFLNGQSIPLPPIPIEPSMATIGLSPTGSTLAVVSNRSCRIVLLGQKKPTISFSGAFEGLNALAVGERIIAIAKDDMSLQVISDRNRVRRTSSTSGEYKAVYILPADEHLVTATDRFIFVWSLKDFPKNVMKLDGVINPCAIGGFNRRIVVVGSGGKVVIHKPNNKVPFITTIALEAEIEMCVLNQQTTVVAYISNEKAFTYSIESGKIMEATWMPEIPVGIAIDDKNQLVLWSEEGKFYREP
jgi:serine/threonine protein kinase